MSNHPYYNSILWLWDKKENIKKPGWGGHNLNTDPSPWTNFSISTLLMDSWEYEFRFVKLEELVKYISKIINNAILELKQKDANGFPPTNESDWNREYSTISTFAFLDASSKLIELSKKYSIEINNDVEEAIINISQFMSEKFNKGFAFMPEYNKGISLVSTFITGYIIDRICSRFSIIENNQIKSIINGIHKKYDVSLLNYLINTKIFEKDQLLPFKANGNDKSIAASSWFLIYILNQSKDMKKKFSKKIKIITEKITQSKMEIEKELGDNNDYYDWFVPGIMMHAIALSPYSSINDITRHYSKLIKNNYYKDQDKNSFFYFKDKNITYNTWPTRDAIMAIRALYKSSDDFLVLINRPNALINNIRFNNRIFVGGSFADTGRYKGHIEIVKEHNFECVCALEIIPINLKEISRWDYHLTDLCFLGIFDLTHDKGGGGLLELARMRQLNKPLLISIEQKKYQTSEQAIIDKLTNMIHTDPEIKNCVITYKSESELKEKIGKILSFIKRFKSSEINQEKINKVIKNLTIQN